MRRMLRVVKFCIERPKRWKFFHRTGCRVRVADGADLSLRFLEVLYVATRARDVAGELHLRRVIFACMADEARKPGVLFIIVAELRIITFRKLEFYLSRFGNGRRSCGRVQRRLLWRRTAGGKIERSGEHGECDRRELRCPHCGRAVRFGVVAFRSHYFFSSLP